MQLRLFFSLGTAELTQFEPNSLIRIARLMGHSNALTLFGCYVQTLTLLQMEMVNRVNAVFAHRRINTVTAKRLLRGLRSPRYFRKLVDKTVARAFEYLSGTQ